MPQFNRAQIEHILNSEILEHAFELLEKKYTKMALEPDSMEKAEPYRQKVKLLKALQIELKGMAESEKLKESR